MNNFINRSDLYENDKPNLKKKNKKQAHLASKMSMPAGTFKNKLNEKQTAYKFT